MRLRLFARLRRSARPRPARGTGRAPWTEPRHEQPSPGPPAAGRHRRGGGRDEVTDARPAARGQREPEVSPFGSPVGDVLPRPARPRRPEPGQGTGYRAGAARAAIRTTPQARPDARPATAPARPRPEAAGRSGLPWYEVAHARRAAEGRRDCGELEHLLHREWPEDAAPPPETVRAIDRLAELPSQVKEILAAGLDAIFVGPGGVPDLDDMARLRGVPLPSGRATWDACAGAYGERKIIVGSRRSAAPDVMCHEIGHALDDIDGSGERWQSDSDEFRRLYDRCLPRLVSYFHRQEGAIGRREFFADAFAAIASRQRPALVDMLGGDTRIALDVMLYFNVRYGI
ncbi:MAG TPA: hypothetical protein VEH31_26600 [Streptosporangiaceae bacterium]|nr:hypothetical protein [Streptosporangiaceae bacterium]